MKFEWDENKAKINLQRHGVSFAEAEEVFDDLNAIEFLMTFIQTKRKDFAASVYRLNDCYLSFTPSSAKTDEKLFG